MDRLIKSDRIETLKNRMLSVPRFASIEQARIITDTYKEHEDEPRIMQRAYSLKNCLEKINISVEPEELIVGNRTAGVDTAWYFRKVQRHGLTRNLRLYPPDHRINLT